MSTYTGCSNQSLYTDGTHPTPTPLPCPQCDPCPATSVTPALRAVHLAQSGEAELEEEGEAADKVKATAVHGVQVLQQEVPDLGGRVHQQELEPLLRDAG